MKGLTADAADPDLVAFEQAFDVDHVIDFVCRFGDACVSERTVVDVIDLVVEAEYARDRYEGNCPERSRSGQLTYLKALGVPGIPRGSLGDPGGARGCL